MAEDGGQAPDATEGAHFSPLAGYVMIALILVLGGIILYQQYLLDTALDMVTLLGQNVKK